MQTINVTAPDLPELDKYIKLLETIWETKQLTNNGHFVRALEIELAEYLKVPEAVLVNNGTNALTVAMLALGLEGEVITTPFSFVATASTIVAAGLEPVFCDICPKSLNIDYRKIEQLITPKTSAILATHCYGHPCALDEIEKIAESNGIKVIYDAAHAFGVEVGGKSLLSYGDISTVSTHATKVFTTIEGGIVFSDTHLNKLKSIRNFGIKDEHTIEYVGINAKMNELSAAFGMLQLDRVDEHILRRQEVSSLYTEILSNCEKITCHHPKGVSKYNYSYFPIIFGNSDERERVVLKLHSHGIFPRKYFAPCILGQKPYKNFRSDGCPVAFDICDKILCLPMYSDLNLSNAEKIAQLIIESCD